MTKFRPCIDLHDGKVKQIVGGTLAEDNVGPVENFVSRQPAEYFAALYASDKLSGGHVIKLGPGNEEAAKSALAAYPGGLQVGGGITIENAASWMESGASHVIVTSWLFDQNGKFLENRVQELASEIGKSNIVIDLSCREVETGWQVAMNRWQKLTDLALNLKTLNWLADYADEFLIHAADVEGLCHGIDQELVRMLGGGAGAPVTYAGGAASFADVQMVAALSGDNVDVTVGSALDIFGGSGIRYAELIAWNRSRGE